MEDNKNIETTSNQQKREEKLFTQEEVSRIVRERLSRAKADEKALRDELTAEIMKEASAKQADLEAREQRLNCQMFLVENGYSSELIDIIDTADLDSFKAKAEKLQKITRAAAPVAPIGSNEPTLTGRPGLGDFADVEHKPRYVRPRGEYRVRQTEDFE